MPDNAAITMLDEEHKIILQVVSSLEKVAVHLREKGVFDLTLLREAVEFMREFADRCHHAKEEDVLFPELVAHGVPLHGCPLDALLHEHKQGRQLVGQLEDGIDRLEAGEADGVTTIVETIEGIGRLYPNHIWKEDEMVFPLVDRLMPPDSRQRLLARFEEVEARNPPGTHERFHTFAAHLTLATSD